MNTDITTPIYLNPDAPIAERVEDLLSRMTLQEKVSQTLHEAAGIPRLGIAPYNWWNECLHGVARAGTATVFPQAIGLASTFNPGLIHRVAQVISDEARAKHHESLRRGEHGYYEGLTFWSPNINIFRDPRWGRGHETYGECPWLTGQMGVAFVRGLQGDDERYLKVAACAKHFAVHSGPEDLRHEFNATCSPRDLHETYLPAFKRLVEEAGVESVMGAYNCVNGEPACAHTQLMRLLRDEWGFDGYFTSDCWAIRDFHLYHKVTTTAPESAALAIRMGCDLNCGCTYIHLLDAIGQGLVSEQELDVCVGRLLRTRFRLGMFDPEQRVPYASIPFEVNDRPEHHALSRRTATESIVLLKNDGILPLKPGSIESLAVMGPNADATNVLLANYAGTPSRLITPLQGIRDAFEPDTRVYFSRACTHIGKDLEGTMVNAHAAETTAYADRADVVIMVLGLHTGLEGEQGDPSNVEASGDRYDIKLPDIQLRALERVLDTGTPTVVVLIHGGPVTLGGLEERCAAIVDAFYPGPYAGPAIADVLTGRYNPAGRLPMTYHRSVEDLPPFEDYTMAGRTYRFVNPDRPPLYPFGYGLSYTRFTYNDLHAEVSHRPGKQPAIIARATVTNVGDVDGDEVTQLYIRAEQAQGGPVHELRGIQRTHLHAGESVTLEFTVPLSDIDQFDDQGQRLPATGKHTIWIGGSQPDPRSVKLTGQQPKSITISL